MNNILFENALRLITDKHAGQTRRNGEPYVMHPIRVAIDLRNQGYDLVYQIAGLFHDLLEDTDTTEEEIAVYGDDILTAVKLLSKNYSKDKRSYTDNILANPIAKAVKTADRIDNLLDACNCGDLKFMIRYRDETREFYKEFNVDDALAKLGERISAK